MSDKAKETAATVAGTVVGFAIAVIPLAPLVVLGAAALFGKKDK